MIAWGQAADWLARLAGEESNLGVTAWKCGAKLVEQLCATKPTADQICDLADKVLAHATVDGVQPLATFLLKKLEHNAHLHDLIRRRKNWPVPIVAVVENLAMEFPGVMRLVQEGGMPDSPKPGLGDAPAVGAGEDEAEAPAEEGRAAEAPALAPLVAEAH